MKILKTFKKKEKTHKKFCFSCFTLFEYTDSDVKYDFREGDDYLYCPKCGKFHLIKSGSHSYIDRSKDC